MGSLKFVNEIIPADRKAALAISETYCLENSLPVISLTSCFAKN